MLGSTSMNFVSEEIFNILNKTITFGLPTVGILGFIFKGWITEWIKGRFAKAVSKELDAYRHDLNRDLEAYKTSLIRDLEQQKANIDLQRTIALKMAEARLDALRELTLAFHSYSNLALLCAVVDLVDRVPKVEVALEAQKVFNQEMQKATIFLPTGLLLEASKVSLELLAALDVGPVAISVHDPALEQLRSKVSAVINKLRDEIYKPPPPLVET